MYLYISFVAFTTARCVFVRTKIIAPHNFHAHKHILANTMEQVKRTRNSTLKLQTG